MHRFRVTVLALSLAWFVPRVAAVEPVLEVGMAAVDITPQLDTGRTVWLAGHENGRRATGVHDPLYARAVVLRERASGEKIALVALDVIGAQHPMVEQIRKRLTGFRYVLVASTHNHEGPDVIGLWGPEGQSGLDPEYLEQLVTGAVAAVEKADRGLRPATACYGTASHRELLKDFRLPNAFDDVMRVLVFDGPDGKPCGLLVQWNTHPVEPDGNTELTRDFFGVTVDALERQFGCPVIYFSGAVGGLMGTPERSYFKAAGRPEPASVREYIDGLGQATADAAAAIVPRAEPIRLTPFAIVAKPVAVPLDNAGYRQARAARIIEREAFAPGDHDGTFGAEIPLAELEGAQFSRSEVAYLRLGELHVAGIPGELYPELVYGEFPQKPEPGVDFPDASLEPTVMGTLPGEKVLLLGLANDEIGYIIPKRQWDVAAPFAYGRSSPQYGERNSMGPETARVLMEALGAACREAGK